MHQITFLALGDSYTIGEAVPLYQSFPYQVVGSLREKGYTVTAPEIIARTGWTTNELSAVIEAHTFLAKYDFVTLLIGVNNQYRGRSVEEYKLELEHLLEKALQLADDKKDNVIVLSIPDYSVTPFAQSMDRDKISKEIELYNSLNKALSVQYKVHYIDISSGSGKEAALLAPDGLHPSEKEYKNWAGHVVKYLLEQLKNTHEKKTKKTSS